jgi:hypothetical protein
MYMARLRLTINDDSPEIAKKLEQTLAGYFPIENLVENLEKVASNRWYLSLPVSYQWTRKDVKLMNALVEQYDYLEGWHYQE